MSPSNSPSAGEDKLPSDSPSVGEDKSNVRVVILALVFVTVLGLLLCAGLAAGLFYAWQGVQQMTEQQREERQKKAAEREIYQEYLAQRQGRDDASTIELLDEMLERHPEVALLHNDKAWLLATSLDESVRDGSLAVEHAKQACELTGWEDAVFLDTLAAAYAEAGNFEAAVRYQEQAVQKNSARVYERGMRQRLEQFRAGEPYREATQ